MKTRNVLFGLPILLMFPLLLRKMGIFFLFCLLVFIYWIPFKFGLGFFAGGLGRNLSPCELGVYFFSAMVLFSDNIRHQTNQLVSTWRKFPVFPFFLYICGAIIAYLVGKYVLDSTSWASIYRVRALCLYPAIICFLCIYLINTKEKAEKVLWTFLLSTLILGLLFLLGRFLTGAITLTMYAKDSTRLSMEIIVPAFGSIVMHPTGAAGLFSIAFALSLNFYRNSFSQKKRFLAVSMSFLFAMILLLTQGRSGLYAALLSAATIWYLSSKARIPSSGMKHLKVVLPALIILGMTYYLADVSETQSFRIRGFEFFGSPFRAGSFLSRIEIWMVVVPMIIRNPFGIGANGLLAMGYTGIGELSNIYGDIWGVHNLILYLLLFSGFVGAIGFLLIFLRLMKGCVNCLFSYSREPIIRIHCIAGIGVCIAFFTNGLTSPVLYDSWEVPFLWIPVGVVMASINLPDKAFEIKTKE